MCETLEKKCGHDKDLVDISGLEGTKGIFLREEFARLNKSYEFHMDFALKVVAFFYAAAGGILSIYFGKPGDTISSNLNETVYVLLVIPTLMSIILGTYFFIGAHLWVKQSAYMCQIAIKLKVFQPLKIKLFVGLLRIFGALFYLTSLFLGWLLYKFR